MTTRARLGVEGAHRSQFPNWGGVNPWCEPSGSGLTLTTRFEPTSCYAIRCHYYGNADLVVTPGLSEFFGFARLYVATAPATDGFGRILQWHNGAISLEGAINLHTDVNAGILLRINGAQVAASSNNVLTGGAWHKLRYYVKVANSGGRVIIELNDVVVIDHTGDTSVAGSELITHFIHWGYAASGGPNLYWDDLKVNDPTGSLNNSWPPPSSITALLPTTADLQERPPVDTSYVETTVGLRHSAPIAAPLATFEANAPVTLYLRAKAQTGGATIQPSLQIDGVYYDASAQPVPADAGGDVYNYVRYSWELNPATGQPWTIDQINALEPGWKAATGTIRVSQMLLEVEGTGGSGCDNAVLCDDYDTVILADTPATFLRLQETSGTVAQDATANNRDGAYVNTPTLDADGPSRAEGIAVGLNGTDEHITIADDALWDTFGAGDFSVELWAYFASLTGAQTLISRSPDVAASVHFRIQKLNTSNLIRFERRGATLVQLDSPDAVVAGRWYHIVGVRDGTNMMLYIDGVLVDSAATPDPAPAANTSPIYIGRTEAGAEHWNGRVAAPAIYPTALSAGQVEAHWDCLAPLDEFDGDDLATPTLPGIPTITAEELSDIWWVVQDPGGFGEAGFKIALKPNEPSPIPQLTDLVLLHPDDPSKVVYQGRVEPIERRSENGEMVAHYGAFGWVSNMTRDLKWWGRLQDLNLEFIAYAGVGPGGYVDTIQPSSVLAFADGSPYITITAPEGEDVDQPAGGIFQLDWRTDPYAPNPAIRRIRLNYSIQNPIPWARFEILAYAPVGSYSGYTTIFTRAHSTAINPGTQSISLFEVGTVGVGADEAVIPTGCWRLLIRPFVFRRAVHNVPKPSVVTMWQWTVGQLSTALPVAASTIVQRILEDSCPALDTTAITATDPVISGFRYESPVPPVEAIQYALQFAGDPATEEFTYAVKHKLINDKYETTVGPRPETIRYKVANVEIRNLIEDIDNLAQRIFVKYVDFYDRPRTAFVEQAVPILDAKDLKRDAPVIDVGRLKGRSLKETEANAQLIANTYARQCRVPMRIGEIRIIDRQVQNWAGTVNERFLDVLPPEFIYIIDTQTGAAPADVNDVEHQAVWRIRRGEYHQDRPDDVHAVLTLGQGFFNLAAIIARLTLQQQ